MGWAGLKNGELLTVAEKAGFDVFITGDKTVQFEQNMSSRKIAVVSLSAPHWPLVKDHIGKISIAIETRFRDRSLRLNVESLRAVGRGPKAHLL
jgi:hypothetical protein